MNGAWRGRGDFGGALCGSSRGRADFRGALTLIMFGGGKGCHMPDVVGAKSEIICCMSSG
jgi:hypothetical protein